MAVFYSLNFSVILHLLHLLQQRYKIGTYKKKKKSCLKHNVPELCVQKKKNSITGIKLILAENHSLLLGLDSRFSGKMWKCCRCRTDVIHVLTNFAFLIFLLSLLLFRITKTTFLSKSFNVQWVSPQLNDKLTDTILTTSLGRMINIADDKSVAEV